MNNNPESELPWYSFLSGIENKQKAILSTSSLSIKDQQYIVHACNAYPKLVKALRDIWLSGDYESDAVDILPLLKELGEWNQ